MMYTDLATIARALDELDCTSIVNNHELTAHIESLVLFEQSMGAPKSETITLLGEQESDDWRILQSTGNYIVIDRPGRSAATAVGPEANALVLSPGTPMESIIRLTRGALEGLSTIHRHATRLLTAALEETSLDSIMDLAAKMLGNPCCLLVMDGSAIAASKQVETGDELWDRLVYQHVRTTEDADLMQILDYAQSAFYDNITRPTFFDVKPWKRRLMAGVWVGSSCNHLFVVLENEQPIRLGDRVVAECVCELLARTLEKETPRQESPTALFEALLRGDDVDTRRAMEVIRTAGLASATPARLAVVFEEDQPPSYLRAMRILDKTKRALPKANAFVHENRVVLSLPYPDAEVYGLLSKLPTQVGMPQLVMGVSHPISTLEEVRRAHRQCEVALELGTGPLRRYEDVMSIDLIRQLPAQLSPAEYCPQVAYDIVTYDRTHETEYAWTILRWLRHFKDARRVAEELHIHTNTVRYRLDRVSELFGVDMADDALVDCLRTSFEIMMATGTQLPRA